MGHEDLYVFTARNHKPAYWKQLSPGNHNIYEQRAIPVRCKGRAFPTTGIPGMKAITKQGREQDRDRNGIRISQEAYMNVKQMVHGALFIQRAAILHQYHTAIVQAFAVRFIKLVTPSIPIMDHLQVPVLLEDTYTRYRSYTGYYSGTVTRTVKVWVPEYCLV
jgi:hypothetical protein